MWWLHVAFSALFMLCQTDLLGLWSGGETLKIVMMPTLSSLTAPQVVCMTTSGVVSDDKVGIMTTIGFVVWWDRNEKCPFWLIGQWTKWPPGAAADDFFFKRIYVNDNYQGQIDNIAVMSSWAWWRLKSPASRLFTQAFIQTQIKENIKAPRHWPLGGEFTGDRWIPRTNGQ